MTKIKIRSNPYNREISYLTMDEATGQWVDVRETDERSRLVVPFSTSGVIGNSSNKFVIFDTPGSNSNSNQDHAKVLAEAMDGFSNGIPLWVTQYDAHDTKDNAELC